MIQVFTVGLAVFLGDVPAVVKADALVPPTYVEVGRAKGDLNGDGIDDVALLVHPRGPKGDAYSGPQRLLLYTGTPSGAYVLWKQGDTHFMETYPNLMEADGFEKMAIEKKVLTISSTTALSMGGWGAGGCTMKWRNEGAGLRLIGLTVTNVDRKCACGTTTDSNLVTGAVIIESDMNDQGEQTKLTRRKKKTKPTTQLWESFNYESVCN